MGMAFVNTVMTRQILKRPVNFLTDWQVYRKVPALWISLTAKNASLLYICYVDICLEDSFIKAQRQ